MLAQFHRRLAIEKVPSTHKKTKTKPNSFVFAVHGLQAFCPQGSVGWGSTCQSKVRGDVVFSYSANIFPVS